MADLMTEATPLGALLAETTGLIGAVVGTQRGELRAMTGRVIDGDAGAATVAVITRELASIGALLGLGELGVASLKAATAARVFARQGTWVLAIEVDAKRPLGGLEARLRTTVWAPSQSADDDAGDEARSEAGGEVRDEVADSAVVNRVPTLEAKPPPGGSTLPPPVTPPVVAPVVTVPRPARRMTGSSRRTASSGSTRPAPATTSTLIRAVSSHAGPTRPPPPAPPPSASQAMPAGGQMFAGDLEELSLPDLLEFLRNSHRTGLLVCSSVAGTGKIQLSRGMIISADSPNALDLREHFLARTELAPDKRRLLAALPIECFGETMIVDELTSRDLVPRDEVERARVARIYSAFREMVSWTSGRFSFDSAVSVSGSATVALNTQSILMQIYQEQDEPDR